MNAGRYWPQKPMSCFAITLCSAAFEVFSAVYCSSGPTDTTACTKNVQAHAAGFSARPDGAALDCSQDGHPGQSTAPARAADPPLHRAHTLRTAGRHITAGMTTMGRYAYMCVYLCVHVQKQTHSDTLFGRTRVHACVGVCAYLQVYTCAPYMCCSPGPRLPSGAVCSTTHTRWSKWGCCCSSVFFHCLPLQLPGLFYVQQGCILPA